MATATVANIGKRVAWLIGARLSNGTYSLDTSDDDRFTDNELKDAIVETETEIVRDICEGNHSQRGEFVTLSSALNHGDLIPDHFGQIEAVFVEPYTAAGYSVAEKTTRTNIKLWRENPSNRFDATAHNQSGSKLGGYYAIDNNTILFTGLTAKVKIAVYTPDFATWVLQLDDMFNNALIAGTIPKLFKFGVPTSLVQHYGVQYGQMRNAIRQGESQMPDIEAEQIRD